MADLTTVEGIGGVYAKKLKEAGYGSTKAFQESGATPKGRKEIAEKTGISEKLILRWVNHVDLFRIKGIAGEYAELPEAAGVDTVPELVHRKAENLHPKFVETNTSKKRLRQVPTRRQVDEWIAQAKQLPRIVTY